MTAQPTQAPPQKFVFSCTCGEADPLVQLLSERVEAGEDQRIVSLDLFDPGRLWADEQDDLADTVRLIYEAPGTPPHTYLPRCVTSEPEPVHTLVHRGRCIHCGRPATTIGCVPTDIRSAA